MKETSGEKDLKATIDSILKKRKDSKKKRSYIADMMKRDREACIAHDEELAKAGVKTKCRDIVKDDPCYGCKFAIFNRDENLGPFDRRFKCKGIPRIVLELDSAVKAIKQLGSSPEVTADSSFRMQWLPGAKTDAEINRMLLKAQNDILCAASLIGELVANGRLECVETNGKPSCLYGGELEEYIKK